MTTQLSRYAGWTAYLSAACVALNLIILITLLSLGLFSTGPRPHSVLIEIVWFSDALIPFLLGIAAFEVWLLSIAYLTRPRDKPLYSRVMAILAMSFTGYPIWAIWLGRRLLSGPVGLPNLENSVN